VKIYTRFIHRIILILRAEEFAVRLSVFFPKFRACIPLPSEYPVDSYRVVTRDKALFKLWLKDCMQWHLFADIPDIGWRLALDRVEEGSVVLDIGTNCGHFTLKLFKNSLILGIKNIQIHAFEPNPKVYEALTENIKLNKIDSKQLFCHCLAMGAINQNRFFDFNDENMGAGHVLKENQSGKIEVSVLRLDDFVKRNALKNVTFIKLDVEGYEPEVFKGAWETLSVFKPSIYFEITPVWYDQNGYDINEVLDRLKLLGYQLFKEENGKLTKFVQEVRTSVNQYNILARHESK